MQSAQTNHIRTVASIVSLLGLIGAAVYASTYLSQQSALVDLVATWGYTAVIVTAVIAGLNAVVPVPAATLTPIFIAADLSIVGVIGALVVGTTLADLIGWLLGRSTRDLITARWHRLVEKLEYLATHHQPWVLPVVFLYAAFVPFPNEALVIPLAVSGVRIRHLLLPLVLGTTVHQLLLVYGVQGLTQLLV